jgi:hypothetical protein
VEEVLGFIFCQVDQEVVYGFVAEVVHFVMRMR